MGNQVVSLSQLQPGMIVRNRCSDNAFVVTANYGNRATAVRTADITNPEEWEIVEEVKSK